MLKSFWATHFDWPWQTQHAMHAAPCHEPFNMPQLLCHSCLIHAMDSSTCHRSWTMSHEPIMNQPWIQQVMNVMIAEPCHEPFNTPQFLYAIVFWFMPWTLQHAIDPEQQVINQSWTNHESNKSWMPCLLSHAMSLSTCNGITCHVHVWGNGMGGLMYVVCDRMLR